MRTRFGSLPIVCACVAALLAASAGPAPALPPIDFMGSRPPYPSEPPLIPLPEDAPLSLARADSVIRTLDTEMNGPTTRYAIFHVDLAGNGGDDQIVQVARMTNGGFFSRAWWGIYSGGRLDQVLYWTMGEQRTRLNRLPAPGKLRDKPDSLGWMGSRPEFAPAVDMVTYGDLNGDGRPETVVWMLMASKGLGQIQAILAPAILSPTPDGIKTIFRTNLLQVRTAWQPLKAGERPPCTALAFRLRTRLRRAGGPLDLLLEPWGPVSPDSICAITRIDERDIPHDPDQWMPLQPMPAKEKVPPLWVISRWEDDRYGGLRYVKDVKLD